MDVSEEFVVILVLMFRAGKEIVTLIKQDFLCHMPMCYMVYVLD